MRAERDAVKDLQDGIVEALLQVIGENLPPLAEIHFGIALLPQGGRRRVLTEMFRRIDDEAAADCLSRLRRAAASQRQRTPMA